MNDYNFLKFIKYEKNYSKLTLKAYKEDLLGLSEYLELDLKDINSKDIKEYIIFLKKKKYESSTIRRKISTFKSFYKYLKFKGILEKNPAANLSFPKMAKKNPKFLYEEEIDKLFLINENINIRDLIILDLLYTTGVRVSELSNIKLVDVNLEQRTIFIVGKAQKQRYVYFTNELQMLLKKYIFDLNKESGYLIQNKYLKQMSDRSIRNIVYKYSKLASMTNVSPHTLRHSFATHLLNNGANIILVKDLLGHENLSTTQRYTHLTKEEIKKKYKKFHPRK